MPPIGYNLEDKNPKKGLSIIDAYNESDYHIFKKLNESKDDLDDKFATFYYSVLVGVVHVGWALIQNAHLSMIPEIASTDSDRTHLTSLRYAANVVVKLFVFSAMWILLHIGMEFLKCIDLNLLT